jgi:hypothetical protein
MWFDGIWMELEEIMLSEKNPGSEWQRLYVFSYMWKIDPKGKCGIQDGDKSADVDSMSSVNQKFCWDAGATLDRKKNQEESNLDTLNPQPIQSCSMLHWETGGLLCNEMPAPNLLGRHSADQQVSK